jgi:DNA-directed RNA polymerase subunit RPC12/RpoP
MNYGSKSKIAPQELKEMRSKLALLKMQKQVPNDYVPPFANSQPYSTDYPTIPKAKKETVTKSSQHYREKFYPDGKITPTKDMDSGKGMSKLASIAQNSIMNNKTKSTIERPPSKPTKPKLALLKEGIPDKLEVPIAALKSQPPLEENEQENIKRIPCKHCGRKFAEQALAKHQVNCEKVFLKKRKVFNTASQRVVSQEQVKLAETGKKVEKSKPAKKMPKWKMQSEQFRKAVGNTDSKGGDQVQSEEINDRVQCPYCGRSFKEETAARHIPFCKNKSEMDKIKSSSKRKVVGKKSNY